MIVAAVAGAWLGAGIVASWPKRNDSDRDGHRAARRRGALRLAQLSEMPARQPGHRRDGQGTLDLQGTKLAIGLVGNFLLGALMTLGIGMYAPCMILVGLLGMNAKAAFPIMMGSCAFLMPVASARFVQKDAYSLRPALGLGDRRHSRPCSSRRSS